MDGYAKFKKINCVLELEVKARNAGGIEEKIEKLNVNFEKNKEVIQTLKKKLETIFTEEEKFYQLN